MDSSTKYYLIVLILGILQAAIIYSVGRSHNLNKFNFHMPTGYEWGTIVILLLGLYLIGSGILIAVVGEDDIMKMYTKN